MLGPVEFLKLITGTGNPAMMFMMGKVKARGDLGLASGLGELVRGTQELTRHPGRNRRPHPA